ncbi:MAG TPA: hypothetical protein VJ242_00740 [Patescibacteria group bacterium]|nr:hypothetical protein [Patescibacteria group bacterium]
MSFEPAEPISVVTCDRCQGKGCDYCGHQGLYGLKDDQPVIFNLPDFIDFKGRSRDQQMFVIKRLSLTVVTLILVALTLTYFL